MLRRAGPLSIIVAALVVTLAAARPAAPVELVVYKSPSCGCCTKWTGIMQKEGFAVTIHDIDTVSKVKDDVGVPSALASCHTAIVEGYVIEGHVPAREIERLLKERPKVVGLVVPGMVAGSPGMESATPQHYDVLAFDANGKTTIFAK
jgi:hypothetical protein